jgi:serine/threonine-protein kinase
VLAFLSGRLGILGRSPLEKPPPVLVDRAQEIVLAAGYRDPPVDTAYGFRGLGEYLRHVRENDDSHDRWDRLSSSRPPALLFWYRQSPRPLVAWNVMGRVYFRDPPLLHSGMIGVTLDPVGRLDTFLAIPPHQDERGEPGPEPDWAPFFAAAELEPADFSQTDSRWVPEVYCDLRRAWEGTYPGQAEPMIRIEACAFRGRPVYFEIVHPWQRPWRQEPWEETRGQKAQAVVSAAIVLVLITAALYLARRNVRLGRWDRRGALRIAAFFAVIRMIQWLLGAGHVAEARSELDMFFRGASESVFLGLMVWLIYVALEPFVRRHWPQSIVSWTRLMSGRLRDPLVGRSVLVGAAIGVVLHGMTYLENLFPAWLGMAPAQPLWNYTAALYNARRFAGQFLLLLEGSLGPALMMLFFLVLFRFVLRRQWLAVAATTLLFSLMVSLGDDHFLFSFLWSIVGNLIFVLCLVRFGLVAGTAAMIVANLRLYLPLTLDVSAWYASGSLLALLMVAALVTYACYLSLGGRPLFQDSPAARG